MGGFGQTKGLRQCRVPVRLHLTEVRVGSRMMTSARSIPHARSTFGESGISHQM